MLYLTIHMIICILDKLDFYQIRRSIWRKLSEWSYLHTFRRRCIQSSYKERVCTQCLKTDYTSLKINVFLNYNFILQIYYQKSIFNVNFDNDKWFSSSKMFCMYISFNAKIFKLYFNGYLRSLSIADFCTLNRTYTATVNELGTNDII